MEEKSITKIPTDIELVRELDEAGMTTAELLGNAALAIAALVGIWLLLQQIGVDVMTFIRAQIGI